MKIAEAVPTLSGGLSLLCACFLLFAYSSVPAHELQWTYTPPAVYAGDATQLAFTFAGEGLQILAEGLDQYRLLAGEVGHWTLHIDRVSPGILTLQTAEGQRRKIRFLGIQDALHAQYKPGQGLREEDGTVVILVPKRQYRDRDRRYRLLRPRNHASLEGGLPLWPQTVIWGGSPLLASLTTWQEVQDSQSPLLLVIDRRESLVGWDPGIFAACLAWISQALEQRGNSPAFLAPIAHPYEPQALRFLSTALYQVAQDQGLSLISLPELSSEEWWMFSQGVSGPWLNSEGQQELARHLQRLGLVVDEIPSSGLLP